jgi:hypothetical protein
MAHLYERTVAELMEEAGAELQYPASRSDVVAWFAEHYPEVKATTVRANIVGLTDNDRSRHHYAWLAKREPLFVRREDGALERFEANDGLESDSNGELESEVAPSLEFALEVYLEDFLLTNWDGIDWGRPLELWETAAGEEGHQLATPIGRLDFLCRDTATNALVVVELKRGRPSDRVVGQAARYMGWVRAELAEEGQAVEGLIVAGEQDLQLASAVAAVPGLSVLTYRIDFALTPAEPPATRGA